MKAQRRKMLRGDAVEQPEDSADGHGDGNPRGEPPDGGHSPVDRPRKSGRQSQHEHRQLESHEGGAGDNARAVAPGNDFRRHLQEEHPADDRDPQSATRAQLGERDEGFARRAGPWLGSRWKLDIAGRRELGNRGRSHSK